MTHYPRDILDFQLNYPGQRDDKRQDSNLLFYLNQKTCIPDGLLIEELHDKWWGKYSTLEQRHGFIQWLFPIREHGVNYQAQPLQPHEILAMRSENHVIERVYASYRLMLDFYGMRLEDEKTGRIRRSRNYEARYANLLRSMHNYLRITRILKSLSELGLEHLNAGFLLFVLSEQSEHGLLDARSIKSSMDRFWVGCIRNKQEREDIEKIIERVRYDGLCFTTEQYKDSLDFRAGAGVKSMDTEVSDAQEAFSDSKVQGDQDITKGTAKEAEPSASHDN